jgi:hypothetical protein
MAHLESSQQSRRSFFVSAAKAAGAAIALGPLRAVAQAVPSPLKAAPAKEKEAETPIFPSNGPESSDLAWRRTWDAAVAVLAGNIRNVPGTPRPLLFEGSTYQGIWQECGPH